MISDPAMLLVSSIVGLAMGATVALLRAVLPRWVDVAVVAVFAIGPLALIGRTPLGHTTGRTLWEWSAVGGATVQASYHIDPLAAAAASVVALATGVALHAAARWGAGPLLAALLAVLGIVLVALVAVTDIVVATLVAGTAATLAVAVGLFVAPAAAAARLAALLALGVEALIAAALLLARAGVASFDLDDLAPTMVSSGVVLAVMLAAALRDQRARGHGSGVRRGRDRPAVPEPRAHHGAAGAAQHRLCDRRLDRAGRGVERRPIHSSACGAVGRACFRFGAGARGRAIRTRRVVTLTSHRVSGPPRRGGRRHRDECAIAQRGRTVPGGGRCGLRSRSSHRRARRRGPRLGSAARARARRA